MTKKRVTMIRVSAESAEWIRVQAEATGQKVVAVVDALVAAWPTEVVSKSVVKRVTAMAAGRVDVAVPASAERSRVAAVAGLVGPVEWRRCPACGCSEVMHRAGESGVRCERHPTCRWAEVG